MPVHFPDIKHNLTATAAPATTDDGASGYREGVSRWIDTLTGTEYRCIDATVGAARWSVDLYAGAQNVAGLKALLGIGGVGVTPGRTALIERFTKLPALASELVAFTDSTGGVLTTPNTLADQNDAVTGVDGTGSNAAGKTDVDARLVTIANNVGKVAAKINTILAASQDFEVTGTNMTSALVTINVARSGIRLTTAGAASDQCILQPRSGTGASRWGVGFLSDSSIRWGGSISFAAVTALKFKLALAKTNTLDLGTDADQVGIYYDVATDGNIKGITSIGGTDVITSTGLAAAAATEYRWEIVIDSSRIARIYIGVGTGAMSLVFTSPALTTAITLYPFIEWQSSSGAKAADVRYEYLEYNNA